MKHYVKTWGELAEILSMTPENLKKTYQIKPGSPVKGDSGHPVKAWIDFVQVEKGRERERVRGPDADVKREKLLIECDILRERLKELRRQTIPMQEHLSEFSKYAADTNSVFELWIQDVAVETKDARLLGRAQELRDRARKRLQEKLDSAPGE
jgi:hypothetical protein